MIRRAQPPAPFASLGYTDDPVPWRRLACALLLGGAVGAYAGDPNDAEWVGSETAHALAEMVDLPHWPPRPEQLASRREVVTRARKLRAEAAAEYDDSLMPLPRPKAKPSARDGEHSPWRQGPMVLGERATPWQRG